MSYLSDAHEWPKWLALPGLGCHRQKVRLLAGICLRGNGLLRAVDNLLCQLYLNQRALGAIPGTAEAHRAPFPIFRFGLTWCPEHTVRSQGMEFMF